MVITTYQGNDFLVVIEDKGKIFILKLDEDNSELMKMFFIFILRFFFRVLLGEGVRGIGDFFGFGSGHG